MSDPSHLVGTTLGNYDLQALLGTGGMASVYRGLDRHLQRPVAIKVIAPTLAADPDFANRFRHEAQLIAHLRHPHIVQIYAFGEQDNLLYMIQELLPGPTLEQRIADARMHGTHLPRQDIILVLHDLAGALDAAHAVGVIHRDVKPSNAIYNAQQQVMLTDFGIARSGSDPTQTAAGVLMGTPGYVAPEQAVSSAALTPACDIYALGVVAFELLTGRRPFEGDTPTSVVLKHLYEAPLAPSTLRSELPPAVDAAVLRALEKEPAARFPSAGAFADAFADAWPDGKRTAIPSSVAAPPMTINSQPTSVWIAGPAPVASPAQTPASAPVPRAPAVSSRRPRWLLLVLGGVLLLILAGGAFLASGGQERATSSAPTVVIAETPTEAPSAAAPTLPTAFSPTASDGATAELLPSNPVADLRALLEAGRDDGRAGQSVGFLLERQTQLEAAVAAGDVQKVEEQLREMRNKIGEQVREGKMEAAYGTDVSTALDRIIAQ